MDAEGMLAFTREIGSETDFLLFGSEGIDCSIEEEQKILATFSKGQVRTMFLAIVEDQIVGSIGFTAGERIRIQHVGEFGMAVKKQYWGLGIGSALIDALIFWCRNNNRVSKINLRVRTDNHRAVALYLKKGFRVEGTASKEIKVDQDYFDHYIMGLYLPEHQA